MSATPPPKNPIKEGDLVWAFIRGWPWWPGKVISPSDLSPLDKIENEVLRERKKNTLLIKFYYTVPSYAWLDPNKKNVCVPFRSPGFEEKVSVKYRHLDTAVREALEEEKRKLRSRSSSKRESSKPEETKDSPEYLPNTTSSASSSSTATGSASTPVGIKRERSSTGAAPETPETRKKPRVATPASNQTTTASTSSSSTQSPLRKKDTSSSTTTTATTTTTPSSTKSSTSGSSTPSSSSMTATTSNRTTTSSNGSTTATPVKKKPPVSSTTTPSTPVANSTASGSSTSSTSTPKPSKSATSSTTPSSTPSTTTTPATPKASSSSSATTPLSQLKRSNDIEIDIFRFNQKLLAQRNQNREDELLSTLTSLETITVPAEVLQKVKIMKTLKELSRHSNNNVSVKSFGLHRTYRNTLHAATTSTPTTPTPSTPTTNISTPTSSSSAENSLSASDSPVLNPPVDEVEKNSKKP